MKAIIILGGNFADNRGEVAFVNDFSFSDIKRFYTITNAAEKPLSSAKTHKISVLPETIFNKNNFPL